MGWLMRTTAPRHPASSGRCSDHARNVRDEVRLDVNIPDDVVVAVAMILQELSGTPGRDFRVYGQVLDLRQSGIEQGSLFECLQRRKHGSSAR